MSIGTMVTRGIALIFFSMASGFASSQVVLPNLGAAVGGGLSVAAASGLAADSLPSRDPVVDTLLEGSGMAFDTIPSEALPGLGVGPESDQMIRAGRALIRVGAIFASQDPGELSRPIDSTVIPAGNTVFPVTKVLLDNPADLPGYFLNGGTILFSGLAIIPEIPLLNSPLSSPIPAE